MVMGSKIHPRKDKLRANLLGLSEFCPVDRGNPDDCPLSAMRKLKAKDRLVWFRRLEEADLVYLAAYHQICLTSKVEPKLADGGH